MWELINELKREFVAQIWSLFFNLFFIFIFFFIWCFKMWNVLELTSVVMGQFGIF